jgi:hypothetical protein
MRGGLELRFNESHRTRSFTQALEDTGKRRYNRQETEREKSIGERRYRGDFSSIDQRKAEIVSEEVVVPRPNRLLPFHSRHYTRKTERSLLVCMSSEVNDAVETAEAAM